MRHRARALRLLTTLSFVALSSIAAAAAGDEALLRLDSLRTYATLHSLGFEWDLAGDTDHDATCHVRYRKVGDGTWRTALDLLRVDFRGFFASQVADRRYDMLAGSILFLAPGTDYEVELTLVDGGDDGADSLRVRRVERLRTRSAPVLPTGPLVFVGPDPESADVDPGTDAGASSGPVDAKPGAAGSGDAGTDGDGSPSRPFALSAALARAAPGQLLCLLPGDYGEVHLDVSGTPEAPIALLSLAAARAAGHREVRDVVPGQGPTVTHLGTADAKDPVIHHLRLTGSHLWIEGLHFVRGAWPDSVVRGGLKADGAATDVVVRGNRFDDYAYSIWLHPEARHWVISDNTIVGRKDIEQEGNAAFSGEGIELQHSEGHTVAYNAITQVADGVSYANRNVDIFGNDIWDTSDDGVEPDYGYANIRMWGNRIANVQYHAFSFQGMFCGPWYILRNQVTSARGAIYKFRVMDRVVIVNNTFVAPSLGRDVIHHLLHGIVRNNLYVRDGEQDREPWRARLKYRGTSIEKHYYNPDLTAPDWRTDWDDSGYDLRGPDGEPSSFWWFDTAYPTVQALAAAVGIETRSIMIERESTFVDYTPPTNPARDPRPVLRLRPDATAVDAGRVLPNVADRYAGAAPDLGAYEVGGAEPHYGPRPPGQRDHWLE